MTKYTPLFIFLSLCLFGAAVKGYAYRGEAVVYFSLSSDCPADKPFISDKTHECFGCDTTQKMRFLPRDAADFNVCSNRESKEELSFLKEEALSLSGEQADISKCPTTYPIKAIGKCTTCDDLHAFQVQDINACEVCPNRESYEEKGNLYCRLKQCPPEAPLSGDGNCLPCDVLYWTEDAKEVCEKCAERQFVEKDTVVFVGVKDGKRWLKKTAHTGCYLIEGGYEPLPEIELEEEVFNDEEGAVTEATIVERGHWCSESTQWECDHLAQFYACNEKKEVATLPELCTQKCPNRIYQGGQCILSHCETGAVRVDDGSCKFCSDKYGWESKEACQQCPNKFFVPPANDMGGRCLDYCDFVLELKNVSRADCARCPNLVYLELEKVCQFVPDHELSSVPEPKLIEELNQNTNEARPELERER